MADTDTADVERIMRRIAVRRVILGLTKHEAAALLGMNPWQVGIWETGRQVPSATNLARYARLVGLRLVTVEPDDEHAAMACLTPDDPALPDDEGGA